MRNEHTIVRCDDRCGTCDVCVWGCRRCNRCRCIEGTLPTDCPDTEVDSETQDKVFMREVDFFDGVWEVLDARVVCKLPDLYQGIIL